MMERRQWIRWWRWGSRWTGGLVAVLLVVAVLWLVPLREITAVLRGVRGWSLLWAVLVLGLQLYLSALRLRLVATRQQIPLTTMQVLEINLVVSFYQLFVPGTVAGAGMRWYRMTRAGGEKTAVLAAVAFNRLLDAFFGAMLGLAFWLLAQQGVTVASGVLLLGLVGLTAVCWLLFARLSPTLVGWLQGQAGRWSQRWLVGLFGWLGRLLVCTRAFAETAVLDLLLLALVSAGQFLTTILHFVFLAWAVGIDLPLLLLGAVRSALQLTGLLPFTFFGVREASVAALLAALGVATAQAVALSLLLSARAGVVALLGGVVELVGQNGRWRRPVGQIDE